MRWTSYRSETSSGALTLHFISCTLKRWHAASTKGSKTRPGRACIPGLEALFSLAFWPTRSGLGWLWRRGAPRGAHQVTNAVLETLASIGVDNTNYSGISMRGGISAGLAARVPEPILFLQSGHGSNCAARNYMVPRDPHVHYETYLAFGLQL